MWSPKFPRAATVLVRTLIFGCLFYFAAAVPATAANSIEWRGLRFEYIGQEEYIHPFDGRSPKLQVRVTNEADTVSPIFDFRLAAVGLGDYPQPLDSGGFATFPNGGAVQLDPGESTLVTCWTAGVYETRFGNVPPAEGESKDYTFEFRFEERLSGPPGNIGEVATLTQVVTFTNLGQNPTLSGPLEISGLVTVEGPPPPMGVLIEAATERTNWFSLGQAMPGPNGFQVQASLPDRADWYLRASAEGFTSRVVAVGDGAEPLALTLEPRQHPPFNYALRTTVETPTGFWRGAVSESEGTFVCFPGQENWPQGGTPEASRAIYQAGRIYKYSFAGEKLWEHAPDWEIWGGDMSPDGRYVAYVLNPTAHPFRELTEFKAVLLDGLTGQEIWARTGFVHDPQGKIYEALELAISPDAQWIAIGSTASGQVSLLDRASGTVQWTVPGPDESNFGQVRALEFSPDGATLYCGSGDTFLRALRVSDGAILWRTHVGGWPFVNGLTLSPDGSYLAAGTKSFDASVVRASDGEQLWMRESGDLDLVFSPDGEHVATFGGRIYDAFTGELVGNAGMSATSQFTPDGEYVIKLDRGFTIHDLGGKQVASFAPSGIGPNGGEQAQWSHVTRDGRYVIVLGRDMAAAPQVGIAIYEREVDAEVLPVVESDPEDQSVALGESVVLSARGGGEGPLSYQWYRDGEFLPGATGPQLILSNLAAEDAGDYHVAVLNAAGRTFSAFASLAILPENAASRINNFSIRCYAGTGNDTLIVGLVTGGDGTSGTQPLLVRGIGPTLDNWDVPGFLADPFIQLFRGDDLVDSNDNWGGDADIATVVTRVSAFDLAPGSADAALQRPDVAAAGYTVHVRGSADATGIALAEIYDATLNAALSPTAPRLVNVSARALVGSGDDILIPGFAIAGSSPKTVMIRAIGPTLADFNVAGAMLDPQLQLYSGADEISANDNWGDDPAAIGPTSDLFEQLGAFPLPEGSRDAVLIVTLEPGLYTAHLRGVDGGTGVALVEVYEVAD